MSGRPLNLNKAKTIEMELDRIPDLMAKVDGLDSHLVGLLAQRFRCSREIGSIKLSSGQPRFDPERVRLQRLRFVGLCVEAGLDAAMAETLITTILDRVIAERSSVPPVL